MKILNCWACKAKTPQEKRLSKVYAWDGRYKCSKCGVLNSDPTWRARVPKFVLLECEDGLYVGK